MIIFKEIRIILCILWFSQHGFSQNGTIDWGTINISSFNQTVSIPNDEMATITYSSTFNVTYGSTTNGAIFSFGPTNASCDGISNSGAQNASGIVLSDIYNSNYTAAIAGKEWKIDFSSPLTNIDFDIYDISSVMHSTSYPNASQGIYNDMVEIKGKDENGNDIYPTLTNIGTTFLQGLDGLVGQCTFIGGTYEGQGYAGDVDREEFVVDNSSVPPTAYVSAGTINSSTGTDADCFSGGFFYSMDINVDFGNQNVSEITIQYKNYDNGLIGRQDPGFAACTQSLTGMQGQAILIGDMDFEVNRGIVSGNVSEDTDNDGNTSNMGDGEVAVPGVSISLYEDTNGDGVLSATELANGPVMHDSDGNGSLESSATTLTDANGNYSFTGVPPGDYIVVETDPTGYASVYDGDDTGDIGSTSTDISNTDTNDNSIPLTLSPGETDQDNNFVDEKVGNISGTVYLDESDNNAVDKQTPLQGEVLELLDENQNPILDENGNPITTVTLADGSYMFANIPIGMYIVRIQDNGTAPLIYDNDDIIDGVDDTESNDGSTTNGLIPIDMNASNFETDSGNDFVLSNFVLPVELLDFSLVVLDDNNVLLNWSTASEINNLGFGILHSRDGREFTEIAFIDGNLNARHLSSYEYIHRDIEKGIHYYRLLQKDLDGVSKLYNIKSISIDRIDPLIIYPTISNSAITLSNIDLSDRQINIFELSSGRKVDFEIIDNNSIDVSGLNMGVYVLLDVISGKATTFVKI